MKSLNIYKWNKNIYYKMSFLGHDNAQGDNGYAIMLSHI